MVYSCATCHLAIADSGEEIADRVGEDDPLSTHECVKRLLILPDRRTDEGSRLWSCGLSPRGNGDGDVLVYCQRWLVR